MHGAWLLGAALVPLNTRLPEAAQQRQAAAAGAVATIAAPLDGFEADVPLADALGPADFLVVLFTSGTEGEPKPVELTAGNLRASADASAAALGSEPSDRWLCVLPLFHVAGLAILVRAVRAATTVVIHDHFDLDAVRAELAGGVTLASLVPTQLRRMFDSGGFDAPDVRALLLGGGAVPPDLLESAREADIAARCTYGMTETGSQIVVTEPWETAGRSLRGAHIEVAGDGEILVRGPMVAPGAVADDGFLHTGDIGHLDRNGRLHVEGRIKELIVTGGEKVAPVAVEAVLLAHPSIADAGVAGTPDREWGEAVTAYVVERAPVSDYEIDAFCRDRLAGYQVPKRILRRESLPRNAAGKLMRAELASHG
jgi:O-succinylbenzoic acid--CoA ligase